MFFGFLLELPRMGCFEGLAGPAGMRDGVPSASSRGRDVKSVPVWLRLDGYD
jgi:hypothetical protein